jgi:hypothetical protein
MGIPWGNASAIYRVQESIIIQLGGRSSIIFSLNVDSYETGKVNKIMLKQNL